MTVAEGNPAVLNAFRYDKGLRDFTGDVLNHPRVKVIDYEGRLYLAHTKDRFDIIDLSLADSAGLSNPGGFAIVEKFAYSREAMASYMRALKDGGILSVTLWNKEEPPKSVLKLYATMAEAARLVDGGAIADRFFVVVELPVDGDRALQARRLHAAEIAKLREHTRAMSFDEIYYPGFVYDAKDAASVLSDYRNSIFPDGPTEDPSAPPDASKPGEGPPAESTVLPATTMGQMAWHHLVNGGWDDVARKLRVRYAPAHQRPALFRRLREAGRPVARHRPAGAAAGRMGLPAGVGDARHRLHRRPFAGAAAAGLRLAHHLQPQPRQVPHHRLLRLPGRRLHHGRGGPDLEVHPGAEQRHGLGLGADHRHAGLLRRSAASSPSATSSVRAPSCRASSWPSAPC